MLTFPQPPKSVIHKGLDVSSMTFIVQNLIPFCYNSLDLINSAKHSVIIYHSYSIVLCAISFALLFLASHSVFSHKYLPEATQCVSILTAQGFEAPSTEHNTPSIASSPPPPILLNNTYLFQSIFSFERGR